MNLQNLQAAHAAEYEENKQPNQKMGRRPKQTFLQGRHTDFQQTKAQDQMASQVNSIKHLEKS